MPTVRLSDDAVFLLEKYHWKGNIRQLRNCAEQVSVLEQDRTINGSTLQEYLPNMGGNLPTVVSDSSSDSDFKNEREILYKVLFDMKSDLSDLKKLTLELMKNGNGADIQKDNEQLISKIYGNTTSEDPVIEDLSFDNSEFDTPTAPSNEILQIGISEPIIEKDDKYHFAEEIEEEETLSLHDKELELIKKSLERHKNKRKAAAEELGISERTLYRKIKQYDL